MGEVGIDHDVFLNSPHCEACELLELGLIDDYKHHHLCFLFGAAGVYNTVTGSFAQPQDRKSRLSFTL